MDGWMGREGGAGCAARLVRPNERGRPCAEACSRSLTFTVATALPVISRPLSESILGSRATRASTERPVSLSVSPHSGFTTHSPPTLVCFIPALDLLAQFLRHPPVLFIIVRLKGIVHPNLMIHLFTTHHLLDGGPGDIF